MENIVRDGLGSFAQVKAHSTSRRMTETEILKVDGREYVSSKEAGEIFPTMDTRNGVLIY